MSIRIKKQAKIAIPASRELTIGIEAEKLSESPVGTGQLPIDILENEKEILIITPIAGVDLDKTEIIVTNDVLTIRGERQTDLSEFEFKKRDYYVQECFWGRFSRSVILPTNVDGEQIEATQKDHVLYIRIPKRHRIQMRIVKIKN
jgi:HSP20 family protein